jgi:outer membrane assembly lipoprotein YfiO
MNRIRLFLAIAVVTVLFASCKSQYDILYSSNDIKTKYDGALKYFGQMKYQKAAALFDQLQLPTQGTPQEDTVRYYLGVSNYRYGDYQIAEANFESFLTIFGSSPFTEEAKYLRIECLYNSTYRYTLDQLPTRKALSAIEINIREYPNSEHAERILFMRTDLSERLDRKSYESAKIYYTIEDYIAAIASLKNVLRENAENIYRENILYYTVMSHYKYAYSSVPARQRERYVNMIDEYYNFISEYPESLYRPELDGLFQKAQQQTK